MHLYIWINLWIMPESLGGPNRSSGFFNRH